MSSVFARMYFACSIHVIGNLHLSLSQVIRKEPYLEAQAALKAFKRP